MRASEPRPRTSCIGRITVSATEDSASRIKSQTASVSIAAHIAQRRFAFHGCVAELTAKTSPQ